MTLEWFLNPGHKQYVAESASQVNGTFRIHYDDVMFWPSWSPDCSDDFNALKQEAQELHDQWVRLSYLTN